MQVYLLLFFIVTVLFLLLLLLSSSYAVENKELDYNVYHDIQYTNRNGVVVPVIVDPYLLLLIHRHG